MATLSITTGAQRGRVFRLKPGTNRIGRSVENDFQVADASVSAYHCEIIRSEAAILVRDLNSTNGTFVDGQLLTGTAPQPLEQLLQVGGIQLELQIERDGADAPLVRIPELPPLEQPVRSGKLSDGSPACANHPEDGAIYHCCQCEQTLCPSCVRVVGRQGGMRLVFCSLCSGACEPLPVIRPGRRKKKVLGWLTSTLKLALRR